MALFRSGERRGHWQQQKLKPCCSRAQGACGVSIGVTYEARSHLRRKDELFKGRAIDPSYPTEY